MACSRRTTHLGMTATINDGTSVLLGIAGPAMVYLAVCHESMLEYSCSTDGSIDSLKSAFLFFLEFWIWPLGMSAAGIVLIAMGNNDKSAGGFFDGCCRGYTT